MGKIKNDKYYTSNELVKYCVEKTKEIIGEENIIEWLEPSAGAGVFLNYLPESTLAYDIDPEDNRIKKQNYLELDLEYKKDRCIIGNPPFGIRNTLSVRFFKKSIELGDYIAFILPISQYSNNNQMYEFDLIHSELIDNSGFISLDKRVKLCFNIYKRPKNNILNNKPNFKLKDVEIIEIRNGNKSVDYCDMRIMAWGGSEKGGNINIGCEVNYPNQYAKEFCIIIKNKQYEEKVMNIMKNTDWRKIYYMPSPPNLLQWQVYKYIKEQIPEIN